MEKKILPENTPVFILACLLIAHFAWIMTHFQPAYASPDAHGYFYQARLIADTGKTYFETESPVQSIGIHWLATEDDKHYSRYPPGFPALLAILYKIGGPTLTLLLNPILTSATIILLFLLCRRMMNDWHALTACAILALNTNFNAHALNAFAHTPVMFFFLAGIVLLFRWTEKERTRTAFLAGLFFGLIPTIRYPDAVIGIGVVAFLFLHWRKERDDAIPGIIAASVGASLPIGTILIHNYLAFGSPLKTGYSMTNDQNGFGWSYFQNNASPYVESLMSSGWGVLFVPAIFGIAGMLFYKYSRKVGYLLLGAIIPLLLVYTAYYWNSGRNGGELRFFLPTLPLVTFAGMWFISRIQNSLATPNWLVLASLVFIQAIIGLPSSETRLSQYEDMAERYAIIGKWMINSIPDGSVVVMGQGACQWVDFAGEWKLAEENLLSGKHNAQRGAKRLASMNHENASRTSPMQLERLEKGIESHGGLDLSGKANTVAKDLVTWAGSNPIYWIGSERQIEPILRLSEYGSNWERVAEIRLPEIQAQGKHPSLLHGDSGGGISTALEPNLAVYRWIRE